jgi:hypothetical protein
MTAGGLPLKHNRKSHDRQAKFQAKHQEKLVDGAGWHRRSFRPSAAAKITDSDYQEIDSDGPSVEDDQRRTYVIMACEASSEASGVSDPPSSLDPHRLVCR